MTGKKMIKKLLFDVALWQGRAGSLVFMTENFRNAKQGWVQLVMWLLLLFTVAGNHAPVCCLLLPLFLTGSSNFVEGNAKWKWMKSLWFFLLQYVTHDRKKRWKAMLLLFGFDRKSWAKNLQCDVVQVWYGGMMNTCTFAPIQAHKGWLLFCWLVCCKMRL